MTHDFICEKSQWLSPVMDIGCVRGHNQDVMTAKDSYSYVSVPAGVSINAHQVNVVFT